ncbi:hypothetical protein HF521_010846 [Silurus meridionalis]|uniref:Protein 4.1 n=1 Tax=Silurus meridionalis TaxID=175797 RepID=A0A8T0AHC0_SILME|nr:hypothetical protein HF521_010846 [Silurus meridionalis]
MTTISCQVILLDDTIIERDLEKKAVGQVLFNNVCDYLNLLERDYFGLVAWDSSKNKVWLDLSKKVHKQIKSHDATFTFSVKFYPPDPSELAEDITRYLLCLQLRKDILNSHLPCPSDMLAALGSYMIQSEYGDYNSELHGKEFFRNIPFAPNQTPELEEEVIKLHRSLKSMSPADADQLFLQNIKTLDMYGVHLHPAKNAIGEDVMLGVCADGLMVYEDEEKTQCFVWPSILNMFYRNSKFQARILKSEEDTSENTIKFSFSSYRACKCLWKNAVEHHAFFRNLKQAPEGLLHFGSRFCFQGPTHAEALEASSTIKRPAPLFPRSALKRKAKETFLESLKRPSQPESDDWFQVLDSDKPRSTYDPDKEKPSGGETLAYKEEEDGLNNEWLGSKVDGLDNELFQMLGGRHSASFQTQQSLSTLSSDTDILESAKLQLWKLQADDWFVLLEPCTYQLPNLWLLKTLPVNLQFESSQTENHGEELEWVERTSEMNIKVVKEGKEFVLEQHEELETGRNLIRPDIVGEDLYSDNISIEQLLKNMLEKIEREGDEEEIDTEVMYEQRTQIIETYTKQRMRGFEEVEAEHELMLNTGQVVCENNLEELKETLLEVESIEQRLQDIERLKVRIQEVEMLERRQLRDSDDWYILLEHKLIESSAPARLLRVDSSEQKKKNLEWKRKEQGERNDWYLLLDCKPLTVSSAIAGHSMDTAEEKAEIRQWIEMERHRANTVIPVQMKDDWHILLESLPRSSQTMKPALPPTEIDIQSPWAHMVEEHKNLGEIKEEERATHVRETDVDVYKETRQEGVQVVEKQEKTIIYNEERRETIETAHEINLVPSATRLQQTVTIKEKAMIFGESQVTVGEKEWKNPATVRQVEDNWFVLFTPVQTEKKVIATEPITLISEDAEADLRPQQTVTIEEEEVTFKKMPMIIKETQVIVGGEERKNPATVREDEDDWFVLFMPGHLEKFIATEPITLISEDAEADLRPQRTVTIEEEEVTFKKQLMIIKETQVIVGGEERKNPATVREDEDDWFVLFTPVQLEKFIATEPITLISEDAEADLRPQQTVTIEEEEVTFKKMPMIIKETQVIVGGEERKNPATVQPITLISEDAEADLRPQQTVTIEEEEVTFKKMPMIIKETQVIVGGEERKNPATVREDEDDWFVLFMPVQLEKVIATVPMTQISEDAAGLIPQSATIKEKEVLFETKPTIIKEKQVIVKEVEKKIPATSHEVEDNWFVLFTPVQIEKLVATGFSDTWILEENRLREVQKQQLIEEARRSHVVNDRRLPSYVPEAKAEERHREVIDDWYILLEPFSKTSVSEDRKAEEDRRRKEELIKIQAKAEDRRKMPADQPMTSTPTAQSVRITRPTYQDESLKRLDITQEITQNIKQDSKVETEIIIKRKRRDKTIEGESIYIRHSNLMLEDSDVTQNVLLSHHASISELKRIFMEDMPVFGPTEWDRRLSSYTPVIYPKLSNGDLFTDIMNADALLVM